MEDGVLDLKYLYIHSRADAAICLLERAALNRVPKACWLPNSSQISRMISGGNGCGMAAKTLSSCYVLGDRSVSLWIRNYLILLVGL